MLDVGDQVPDFELPCDQIGPDPERPLKLSRLKAKLVVLFFYPKDDTAGCTAEAKDFSRLAGEFKKLDCHVVGISTGDVASKAKFRKKHGLGVHLAADIDHRVADAFGVYVEKSMYGKKYMGIERATFLIDMSGPVGSGPVDKAGTIATTWRKVKVPGHADAVLLAAQSMRR